ncbi:MAG: 16S rRNA (adenine(1518)-N(6)/adenine(1519)-N(6))-dimethyltransferase RsmA [Bacteroidota bacterium]|nr:16S rRNA (adenine(1518)-N(6)/adenine(1519)-N(6))-dimethyltransferase RsmA [Cytophagales bacterium]MCE2958115.1 16S rRNA (adenine(1518)-N(6)/adenine(1519)-N(6))-dimethyltransferase RsmA [Flammeovirgaceae bacterium]MCZ8068958.1 16S rRNA (adenine(1518)-N(6)/adenine(1519)-N(6))-dimethyltransferase RsmA [Cytophagales bacterium]
MVRPKKFLGQHFLKDQHIAQKIVDGLVLPEGPVQVIEIGPGTGVLTQYLMTKPQVALTLFEIDRESVAYLKEQFPSLASKIVEGDFLQMDLEKVVPGDFHIIGNFPYNISSQIFFKVLEHRQQAKQIVCMLQKEVADRIAEKEGSKTYGILSVMLQAYYHIDYLFKVPPGVFFPPPKVMSAVIRLTRNNRVTLGCDEALFKKVVKQSFQNRRKTLRNALKPLNLKATILALPLMDKRAEQLSVEQFISLTQLIEQG